MEMTKTIQDLKTAFNKEIEALTQAEGKIKSTITQPANPKESLISRMNQEERGARR